MSGEATQGSVKHTQGPWVVETWRDVGNETVYGIVGAEKAGPEEAQANARLIAAAPDLLEAAKEALAIFEFLPQTTNGPVANQLRAAITKAEGSA